MTQQQRKLRTSYTDSVKDIAGRYERRAAWLGLSKTQIQAETPDLVYIRFANNQVARAINKLAPLIYNYPIVVSRNDYSSQWEVVELRQVYGGTNLQALKDHHATHEYPSQDTVWIRDSQFMPLLVLPFSGSTVSLFGGVVRQNEQYYIIDNQSLDLSSYQPEVYAVWALIEIVNGIVTVTLSAEYDSRDNLTYDLIPIGTGYPLCAIMLYGQDAIQRNNEINDIVDLRFTHSDVIPEYKYRDYLYANNVLGDATGESFRITGALATGSNIFGAWSVGVDCEIQSVVIYVDDIGTANETTVDMNINGVTAYTTQANRPSVAYDDVDKTDETIPDVVSLVKGDIVTFDIDAVATGAIDLSVTIIRKRYEDFGWITDENGDPVYVLENLEI